MVDGVVGAIDSKLGVSGTGTGVVDLDGVAIGTSFAVSNTLWIQVNHHPMGFNQQKKCFFI